MAPWSSRNVALSFHSVRPIVTSPAKTPVSLTARNLLSLSLSVPDGGHQSAILCPVMLDSLMLLLGGPGPPVAPPKPGVTKSKSVVSEPKDEVVNLIKS